MKRDFQIPTPAPAILVGAGLFTLFAILYWESIGHLIFLWHSNESYSHGFLIPFLSIYLITQKNKALTNITLKSAPLLLAPLLLSLFLWLLASITDTRSIELIVLPFIFIFAYTSIIGYRASLLLISALLYLLVAIPIWNVLTPVFQSMAVFVNELALRMIGISTFIKGTTVSIPSGTFEIEGGCAGIRYLVVTLALGGFFSLSNFKTIKPIIILMTASLILPVIFNWIRIYIIILIGHFTEMQSPLVSDHKNFGWVLYGISLIPLFLIAKRLTTYEATQDHESTNVLASDSNHTFSKTTTGLALTLLVIAALSNLYLNNRTLKTHLDIATPSAVSPWVGPIHYKDWKPDYKGASIEFSRLYIGSNSVPDVSLHILYYGKQTQDSELINELNSITDSQLIQTQEIRTLASHKVIESHIISNNSKNRLVWHWYFVDTRNTTRPVIAKLLQSKELISGTARSSLIAISTQCRLECDDEGMVLQDFINEHLNNITHSLSK